MSDIHVTPGNANEQQLKAAVAEINKSDVDVVVLTGDLTNEGSDAQLRNVKSILYSLTKPLYVIPGNHENTWSQSACKTFSDLWGADRFVFNIDSLVVVGMNCGPFMKMGDGHIKQEDLLWLDKTLAERVKPGMKVFSFNHYPINADLDKGLREMCRVLKKGGHLCIVELTEPVVFPMKQLFRIYSHTVLPFVGRMISKDTSAYGYLTATS